MMNLKAFICTFIFLTSFIAYAGNADNGQKLYSSCVQCHGDKGMGNVSEQAPKIAGQYDWYIVSSIKAFKEGTDRKNAKMLPYIKNLSDQDIDDLATYISQMK